MHTHTHTHTHTHIDTHTIYIVHTTVDKGTYIPSFQMLTFSMWISLSVREPSPSRGAWWHSRGKGLRPSSHRTPPTCQSQGVSSNAQCPQQGPTWCSPACDVGRRGVSSGKKWEETFFHLPPSLPPSLPPCVCVCVCVCIYVCVCVYMCVCSLAWLTHFLLFPFRCTLP